MTKELREQRAAAWAQAKEFSERAKRGDELSAEDEAGWERALSDVDRLGTMIDTRELDDKLEKRFSQIDAQTVAVNDTGKRTAVDEYRDAYDKWMRNGMRGLEDAERSMLEANFRAQGEATGSAGGYTVPTAFWAKVTETMKWYGGAANGAEIVTTDTGNPLQWPTNDDTANVGYQLGENTAATSEGDLTFGQKSLGNYTYVSGPILASLQLIQDSGIDVESFIARKMGTRIGRIENTRFTTGTGSSQPQGYITGATTGKTTAGATAITFNEILDLVHSVDAAYRQGGQCAFKMHDLVLAYVRKIRDDIGGAGLGRPLWEPSVQVGVPDTYLGYPIIVNNDMASTVATTNKTIAFGDFQSGFVVRKINGGAMRRLEERYAEYLQVGFLGWERADALVQDSSAYKLLVQA